MDLEEKISQLTEELGKLEEAKGRLEVALNEVHAKILYTRGKIDILKEMLEGTRSEE